MCDASKSKRDHPEITQIPHRGKRGRKKKLKVNLQGDLNPTIRQLKRYPQIRCKVTHAIQSMFTC